ncbi:hypothetical protein TUM4630_15750 [Shewanella algidipiscicola]|uniref:Uncharacterized protein n=1 Tax=Shewanella algidipiscicola TaxID=614070 RepID=A0ABQ4PEX5_9GAMM|nr:hypothetical protein TUM4630_15750 [Shewanella algidipiscicola]
MRYVIPINDLSFWRYGKVNNDNGAFSFKKLQYGKKQEALLFGKGFQCSYTAIALIAGIDTWCDFFV